MRGVEVEARLGRDAVVKAHAAFGFSGGETVGASGVGAAAAGAALAIPNVERVTFEADEDEDEEDEEERDDRGVRVGDGNGDSLNGASLNGASLNGASTFSCVCFVGCGDGGVYAYDARRARVVARLDASGSAAVVAAVSPPLAPERLFTAAADGVAKLWDVAAETGGGREAAATSATFRRAAASFSRGSPGYRRRLRVARGGAFVATYGVAASAAAVVGGEALREAMGIPALGASGAFGAFGGVRFGPAVRAAAARDAGAPGHASSFRWTGDDAGAAFVADPVTTTPLLSTLACDPLGALAIVGGHSGEVAAWDPRYAREAWRAAAPRDVSASSPERGETKNARARASVSRRVSGVVFAPCLSKIITASEDGVARLLDLRRCGELLDAMDFGAGALTCAVGVGARQHRLTWAPASGRARVLVSWGRQRGDIGARSPPCWGCVLQQQHSDRRRCPAGDLLRSRSLRGGPGRSLHGPPARSHRTRLAFRRRCGGSRPLIS